jgi:hypothetical protein
VSLVPGVPRGKPNIEIIDQRPAYEWHNVINKPAPLAIKNADNYAFLGLWAKLADLGYSLPRVDEAGMPKDIKEQREFEAVSGFMAIVDPKTRKRMPRPMLFSA